MADGFVLAHFILDGPLFDDPVTSIFGLVAINLGVFALIMFALYAVKEGRKMASREAKARRKALRQQSQSDQFVTVAESTSTAFPNSASSRKAQRNNSRPLATAGPAQSKNYTRPSKKGRV